MIVAIAGGHAHLRRSKLGVGHQGPVFRKYLALYSCHRDD